MKIPSSLIVLMFFRSILVVSIGKNVSLNMINLILKFGDVWMTCFRYLDFGGSLLELELPME